MRFWTERPLVWGISLATVAGGCATTTPIPTHQPVTSFVHAATKPVQPSANTNSIRQVSALVPTAKPEELPQTKPSNEFNRPVLGYAQRETLPIDLPTVIRLIDENSPTVGIAQARVREAQARARSAEIQWLPNLSVGAAYTRFDGQTQNQRGEVFGVSRGNLFAGGGTALSLDIADAIFRPLVERRLSNAEMFREQATGLSAELDGVNAYLDLVQYHAQLVINSDTLEKAQLMLKAAQNAREANLDRTAGDVNRAEVEVAFRKAERLDIEGKAAAASARLSRLLLLSPSVKLVPADQLVAPITLIDPNTTLDQLVETAVSNRPDLAAHREAIAAAWAKVRQQNRGPLFPKLTVANQTGAFGGGLNDNLDNFAARNALSVQLYWEVKNLGFGNRADAAERRAVLEQSQYQLVEAQARASGEIVETAQLAAAKLESLELAEQGVKAALELYRINKEGTFNVVDAKNLFDALRPLQAIQVLNQARQTYLSAVMDYNRAQYRLFTLTGNPPRTVIPSMATDPPQ